MPSFTFPLEVVLQQRRMQEDQCQRELAKILRERMILLDQIRLMQTSITQSKSDLRTGLVGQVNVDAVSQFARFSAQTAVRARMLVTRLAGVERQAEASRGKLIVATKARKALERLREKQFTKWRQEQMRREGAMLDEIGVGRFAFGLASDREV